MQRKKASDPDQGLLNLFDQYVHGIIDRRGFLSAASGFAAISRGQRRQVESCPVGVVGFCYGGGIANMLATRLPDLTAAVPFYGNRPGEFANRQRSCLL